MALLFTFCKKEESFTFNEMISGSVSKSWEIKNIYADTAVLDDDVEKHWDLTEAVDTTYLDDIYVFEHDSSMILRDGEIKSNSRDTLKTGQWAFNELETTLKTEFNNYQEEYLIYNLSNSSMELIVMNDETVQSDSWLYRVMSDVEDSLSGGEMVILKFMRSQQ
jgi:hypothetical protein